MDDMFYDPGTEAEALDTYDGDDYDLVETETEKMCRYHEIDVHDLSNFSNNDVRNMWWNYRKLGKRRLKNNPD